MNVNESDGNPDRDLGDPWTLLIASPYYWFLLPSYAAIPRLVVHSVGYESFVPPKIRGMLEPFYRSKQLLSQLRDAS